MRPFRASLSIPLLVLLPLPAAAEDGVSAPPLAVGGVLLLVGLLAWGLGRHAAAIRADFVRLAAEAPPADRLAAFRDAPGGLPEGSIRAALAFFIVLLCLPALVLSRALGLAGTGELGTILGGVIGFYFGTRSAGGEAEGARRQAEAAQAGRALAEQDAAAARAEGAAAHQEAATRARDAATATEGLSRLAAAAAAGTAVARAVAALLPGPAGAALNGAAGAIPAVQAAIEDPTPEASQEEAAAALSRLLDPGAGAWLFAEHGSAFASATEAEAAVASLRRVMLETELDRADTRPAGALSQAALRTELDRLREAGAGGAIDTLALLAEGLIGRDGVGDFPALVTRALTEAAS